jgi:ACS family glucarate transporter-like MFS transporter
MNLKLSCKTMPSKGGASSILKSTGANPRGTVILFSIALAAFTSMDRSVLSLTRARIAAELKLSDVQMGLIFGAFTIAYAICEIPSGFLGDRTGPEGVMMRIALWWGGFMAATAATTGFASLYLSQFLFGGGASGCYPSIARAFANFLSPRERASAQGMIWLGARWGGASTPIIMAILFRFMGWRAAFLALSLIGLAWAVAFRRWFPLTPRVDAAVVRPSIPWGTFARSKTVWLLCGQYFALVFPWFFLVTWVPAFIDERFHPAAGAATIYKVLPLLFGGLGALAGGLLSGPLSHRLGGLGRARKTLAFAGFAGASGFLCAASALHSAPAGVLAIACSSFCNDLVMPTAWGTASDVAGRWSGTVSAIMNMVGNTGGALFGFTAGVILQATHHNWNLILYMNAAVYLTGIVMWLAIDPERQIES